ncbi:MAG: DUF1501 domain-containing protein [Planctomycetales bacterium]|nr:DUF1501 domain-containing protein [Planctomycetales bacterium]
MLRLFGPDLRHNLSRRELLQIGGLAMTGLTLESLMERSARAESQAAPRPKSFGAAKNCIILYLSGGPPQQDMWDLKPDAPADIRGEFGTIETSLPGVRVGEHLPLSSKLMHKVAQIRSMYHSHNDHARGSYWMFTGYPYLGSVPDANNMSRQDMPHMGSCISKIAPGKGLLPFAMVPPRMDGAGGRRVGQFAGLLGPKYDPLLPGGDPNDDDYKLEQLPLAPNLEPEIVRRRLKLVEQLDGQVDYLRQTSLAESLKDNQSKALSVVSSDAVRKAVDLSSADRAQRERYGRNQFGQSVLLGRRLLEAGTRLVQCNWQRSQGKNGFAWDTHWNNFSACKEDLIPPFDRAFHALMTDLEETGQLAETLVVVAGEFGRSPKVTLKNGGREHWPDCYTVLFAGAGIKEGQIYGSSDKIGAYPADNPTTPADFVATIYHLLGIDPHREEHDQLNRPFALSKGNAVQAILT